MKKILKQIMVAVMLLPLPVLTSISAKADEVLQQNEVVVNQEGESSSETTTNEETVTNEEDSLVTDEDKQLPLVEENKEVENKEEVNNFEVVYQDYQQTTRDTYNENTDEMSNSHSEGKNNAGNQELIINSNGRSATLNENGTEIINGKIVKSEPTVFSTLGGSNKLVPFYKSVDDCINRENQIPISGAAYDGLYLETIVKDGSYIAKVVIGGLEGYVDVNNIQIIPSELVKARSYYVNENGTWKFYEAVDPVNSQSYTEYNFGDAPEWSNPGEQYVAGKETTYQSLATGEVRSGVDYFQHLPLRSMTEYTPAQFQSFLASKGKTNSQYYNGIAGFFDGGKKKGVNPLVLFAMANHESAYGTSNFARRCNNFYGRGAYDSDPNQACQIVGFNTPYDGAAAQAYFLSYAYADALDWRYYGSHPGDKTTGMNVKYASDPNWGKKLASHIRDVDNYLGKKENNKYSLASVSSTQIYKNSGLTTPRTITDGNGTNNYRQQAINGFAIPTIVTGKIGNSYRIQLDTPINLGATRSIGLYAANRGSFPNYEGPSNPITVPSGSSSYVVDYGANFEEQQGYVTPSAVRILNHNNYKIPSSEDTSLDGVSGDIVFATRNNLDEWSSPVSNGGKSGQENYNNPLTGFKIKSNIGNDVIYSSHVAYEGWHSVRSSKKVSGSENNNALEAIQIDLSDKLIKTHDIYYRVYIKDNGWLGWAKNGELAGSVGYSKPIYAMQVQIFKKGQKPLGTIGNSYLSNEFFFQAHYGNAGWTSVLSMNREDKKAVSNQELQALRIYKPSNISGDVIYQAHVQNRGWMNPEKNGTSVGTVGDNLRVEAIKIKTTGDINSRYELFYRTNLKDIGWGAYANNYNASGSEGISGMLLSTELRLVNKGSTVNGVSNTLPFGKMLNVTYHQQNYGNINSTDCVEAGKTGSGLRLEAIKLKSNIPGLDINYQTHIQNVGWQGWKKNGELSGTSGRSLRLEAMHIKLSGPSASNYDVYYRTHVQNQGWHKWVKNGEMSGTSGQGLRIESLQIKIVPKTSTINAREIVPVNRKEEN